MRKKIKLFYPYLQRVLKTKMFPALLTGIFLLAYNFTYAQPANDACVDAIFVTPDGTCTPGDLTGATNDLANGSCATGTINAWYAFEAEGPDYTITVNAGAGFDAEITLVQFSPTSCDFASANQLDCGTGTITGTGLGIGERYYVIITSANDTEATFEVCIDTPPAGLPPDNDDPCAPTGVTPNGTCVPGTTTDATGEFFNPTCSGVTENSVWFSTTLSTGNNSLNVNLQNTSITGNVSINVITFAPDCNGSANIVAGGDYCGSANTADYDVDNLVVGTVYYIQVITQDAEAGDFELCVTEEGPPPGCALNDLCSAPEVVNVPVGTTQCVVGCNSGASAGPSFGAGGGCFNLPNETVWYSFTPPATTTFMTLSVTSADLNQPQIAVFTTPDCNNYTQVNCITGNGGTTTINNQSIVPGVTYIIAVSDQTGLDGEFDLCIETTSAGSNCNTDSDVTVVSTSLGSPASGPFQPGEQVEICLNVNNFNSGGGTNNCQWFHGLVPSFGDCWQPSSFLPTGEPAVITNPLAIAANNNGQWQWFTNGQVLYNNINPGYLPPGSPVGSGWFFNFAPSNGDICTNFNDPNCTYGDGGGCNDNNGYSWQVCFMLTANGYPACESGPTATDCTVSFRTFGDGETGGWSSQGCEADIPMFNNLSLNCCEAPTVNPAAPQTICSGDQTSIILSSDQDPLVTYTWEVLPSAIDGASSCTSGCGNTITQNLTNPSPVPGIVTYLVTATSASGCISFPVSINVTVLPEIDITFLPIPPVCAGSCVDLNSVITGGDPPYSYQWDNGIFGSTPTVCPNITTTYNVTVTDASFCTQEASIQVQANSNLTIEIQATPDTFLCSNDPAFPILLTANVTNGGSGAYSYQWSTNSPSPFIAAPSTDFYCVTVTDLLTQCTGEICQFIDAPLAPFVLIIDPGPLGGCLNNYCLSGVPSGGVWSGVADPFGCVSPSNLGGGMHEVTYTYTDPNTLCTTSTDFDIEVIGATSIDTIIDVTACNAYILPAITGSDLTGNESYYTGSGGTGTAIAAGTSITSTTTLFAYDDDGNCSSERMFNITITPQPDIDDLADVTACNEYILPAITGEDLTGNESYYDGTGGTGTAYSPGDAISTDIVLFIYDGVAGCDTEQSFSITINPQPDVNDLPDVTACNEYILPAITGTNLSGSEAYYTATNGGGTSFAAGASITSTTTLFIYDEIGGNACSDEESFIITIINQPDLATITNVVACNEYILPAIVGNDLTGNEAYYTATGGTGTSFNPGDAISTTTTLFVYDDDGSGNCNDEVSFMITINPQPDVNDLADVTACNFYMLPAITGTNLSGSEAYYTAANGGGTSFAAGAVINMTTSLFIYDEIGGNACSDQESVVITIVSQPDIDDLVDATVCNQYILPAITGNNLSGNEAYYSGPNGTGTTFAPGAVISASTTLFLFDNNGINGCEDEESFVITITPQPDIDDLADAAACNTYTLPAITGTNLSGNEAYFTGSNGSGTMLSPGAVINSTTTLFIYDNSGTVNCDDEESFTITITQQPDIFPVTDVESCDSYILPAIAGSNLSAGVAYYSGTGGTGTSFQPGDVINSTTTLFIYDSVGNNCEDEESFTITIIETPTSTFTVDSPICNTETSTITFTGSASNTAVYNWNFGGGTIVSGSDAGPYEIQWSGSGTFNVSLSVDDGICSSTLTTEAVDVEAPLAIPVINCSPTTTSIEFTWLAVPGAVSYNVTVVSGPTGSMNGPTSYLVDGLTPNTSVEIMVEAVGTGPCGNSSASLSCTATNCPDITLDLTPVADICQDATLLPFNLVATPINSDGSGTGTWSGPGIIDPVNGTFDPNDASLVVGPNVVVYTFLEASCSYNDAITINIFSNPSATFQVSDSFCEGETVTVTYTGNGSTNATYDWDFSNAQVLSGTGQGPYELVWNTSGADQISLIVTENGCSSPLETIAVNVSEPLVAPVINCSSTTTEIVFSWNDVPGAVGYDVFLINGVPGVLNGNTYTVSGLSPNDEVTISVTALSDGICPNSTATEETCFATNCPAIVIAFEPISNICLDGSQSLVDLEVNILGSNGGNGIWTGPGIIDQIDGVFNPDDPSALIGDNVITFTYTENSCVYSQNITVVTINPPTSLFTVSSPLCLGDLCEINYTGNGLSNDNYIWNFNGGNIISGSGNGPYQIEFTTTGDIDVELQVEDADGCLSPVETQTVTVIPPLNIPVINCTTTLSSVEFDWDPIIGASGYTINVVTGQAGVLNGTTYLVENLMENEVVTIEVTAVSNSVCANAVGVGTCQATSCPPIIVFIEPVPNICLPSDPITLVPTVQGGDGSGFGVFSGNGIIDPVLGIFDPEDPSVIPNGPTVVTYTFQENGCVIQETMNIFVYDEVNIDFTVTTPVCVDESSTIMADVLPNAIYNWDWAGGTVASGTDAGPYDVSWSIPGIYTITLNVIDENGCTAEVSHDVEVIAPLVLPVINCETTTSTINFTWAPVTGATGYSVNVIQGPVGVLTGTSYLVSGLAPLDEVIIELTVEGDAPCGDVMIEHACIATDCPPITLDITPVNNLCNDNSLSPFLLTVMVNNSNGTGTGSWSGLGVSTAGMFDPNTPGLINGPNIVTYTFEEDGCAFNEQITINNFTAPSVVAQNNSSLNCTTTSIPLLGIGTGTDLVYSWVGPGIVSGADTDEPIIDQAGMYTVTVIDTVSFCFDMATVTVDPGVGVPIASAGPDLILTCDNPTDTLFGMETSGNTSNLEFVWEGPGINNTNINSENPVVGDVGTYVLTITDMDQNCASDPDTVMVIGDQIAPIAVITQPIDTLDCIIQAFNLQGNIVQDGIYSWWYESPTGPPTSTEINLSVEFAGMYYLQVIDTINGCSGLDSIDVIDNEDYPIILLPIPDIINCDNPEAELNATGSQLNNSIVIEWTGPGLSGPDDEIITSAILPGQYTLTLRDTLNGCENDSMVIVGFIDDAPIAAATDPDELDCQNTAIMLDGSISSGVGGINFEWIYNNAPIATNSITEVDQAGVYSLIVSNVDNDCSDTTFVNVIRSAEVPHDIGLEITEPSCYGENDGRIYIDTVIGGLPEYTYSIDGETFSSFNQFNNLTAGEIELSIEDAQGCIWDTTFVVPSPPELEVKLGDDFTLQLGQDTIITAIHNLDLGEIDTLIWTPFELLSCVDTTAGAICEEVYVYPLNEMRIGVTLIDTNNCVAQDELLLRVKKDRLVYIPNIFSPNGDNFNDILFIQAGLGVKQIKSFLIYDRWGEIMYEGTNFQPNNPSRGWDGTLDGQQLNPAVFVYWAEVELEDGQTVIYKGDLTLIR